MKFILTCIIFAVLIFVIDLSTRKFVNPYCCFMLLGGPGSGKTTYMTKYAYRMMKKKWNIFSNIEGVGTQFNPSELGSIDFPPESVVMVDETSLSGFDGRAWKQFDMDVNRMIKCHRKNKLIVVFSSQGVTDADKRLRDCMDYYIICRTFLRVWVLGKRVVKRVVAVSSKDAPGASQICDDYRVKGLHFAFIPAWYKKFDTNSTNFGLEKKVEKK